MKLDEATRDKMIETAVAVLAKEYVFPDSVAKIEKRLRANAKAKRYDLKNPEKLAKLLTDDLADITKMKTLGIEYRQETYADDPPFEHAMSADDRARQRAHAAQFNGFIERVERLPGNIGYIRMRAFVRPFGESNPLAAAMSFVADTEELIIDLRDAMEHDPETVALVASYFVDGNDSHRVVTMSWRANKSTREYWTLPDVSGRRYTKPLYVLVSGRTQGSAEDFAAFVQAKRRGKVVGEPTSGATFDYRRRKLAPNFALFVPVGKSSTKVPVKPDVKAEDALEAAYLVALKSVRKRTDLKKMPKGYLPNFSDELDRVLEKAQKKSKPKRR